LFSRLATVRGGDRRPKDVARQVEDHLARMPALEGFQTPLVLSLFALVAMEAGDHTPIDLDLPTLFDQAFEILARQRLSAHEIALSADALQFFASYLLDQGRSRHELADRNFDEQFLLDALKEYCGEDSARAGEYLRRLRRSAVFTGEGRMLAWVHRSFFEHFLARRLAIDLRKGKYETFSSGPLSGFTMELLRYLCDEEALHRALASTRGRRFEEVGYLGGNAITSCATMASYRGAWD
jgi:hypothetical protein